jgi:hypothetical protein
MKYLLVVSIVLLISSLHEIVDCNNGKLCDIQLLLNTHLNEAKQLKLNSLINQTEIVYANTYYNVLCVTNEPVRSRNFISLVQSNNDLNQNNSINLNGIGKFDDLSKHEIIGNKTSIDNSLFYLSTGFIINSNNIKNYTLFCRFLTINPSIYCEKSLNLIVKPYKDRRFLIFFLVFFFIVLVIITAILVNLYLRRRVKNENENTNTKSDFERKLSQRSSHRSSSSGLRSDLLQSDAKFNNNPEIYSTSNPLPPPPPLPPLLQSQSSLSVKSQDLQNQEQDQFETFENYAYSIYPITDEIQIQIDESPSNVNSSIRLVNNLPQFEQKIYFYKSENLIS